MSKVNLIFKKTPREKETLKTMKREVNKELVNQHGSKRVGNKQFSRCAKSSLTL